MHHSIVLISYKLTLYSLNECDYITVCDIFENLFSKILKPLNLWFNLIFLAKILINLIWLQFWCPKLIKSSAHKIRRFWNYLKDSVDFGIPSGKYQLGEQGSDIARIYFSWTEETLELPEK